MFIGLEFNDQVGKLMNLWIYPEEIEDIRNIPSLLSSFWFGLISAY